MDHAGYAQVVAPPTISKAFNPVTIQPNGVSTLTFTITNPNGTVAAVGVAFDDFLQAGLSVATPNGLTNSCGGTAGALTGSGTISLSGGTIVASGLCTVAVNILGTPGIHNNTSQPVISTNGGTGTSSNTATLTVVGLTYTPTNTPTGTPTNTPTSTRTNTPTNTPIPTSQIPGTPTSTPVPQVGAVVPTLNESGMLIFGLLIAAAGLLLVVRRR
jgi:hypothetical protein